MATFKSQYTGNQIDDAITRAKENGTIAEEIAALTSGKADKSELPTIQDYFATVTTSWTASGDIFTQTVTVNGIQATDTPIADLNLSSASVSYIENIEEAWGKVYRIACGTNSITLYATEEPATAFSLVLKVVR